MQKRESLTLTATILPSTASQNITWSVDSSNVTLAVVSGSNGRVVNVSASYPGVYKVTAASVVDDSIYSVCWITVTENNNNFVNATHEFQEQDQWCWVASARIAATNYNTVTRSQSQGYIHAKRIPFAENKTGNLIETVDAAEFFTNDSRTFSIENFPTGNETRLRNLIDQGHPILIARFNNSGGVGHMSVIYGYTWSQTSNAYIYYIHDPWDVARFNIGDNISQMSFSYMANANNPVNGIDDENPLSDSSVLYIIY
ncbi:hypothetical protein LJB90_00355 [Eubacteriales bacterium OttesenSCG-928-G02]|nr:hypothetical protein [Eubacteriales bacterium OttesenSCG-928-G02]